MRWRERTILFLLLSVCSLAFPAPVVDKKAAAEIDLEIEKIRGELVKIRRFIHMNPQLPGREGDTAKLISGRLQALGLDVHAGAARTGVVGLLRGAQPGAWVAFRADMDADSIQELADVPFRSLNAGVMHAGGHDIHTTIGLGAAMVLSSLKDRLRGGVKFIFQPGDEKTAEDEEGGAALMIREGVLDNPPVVAVFGMHLWPELLGLAFAAPGPFLAAADAFHIQVRGRTGTAGQPAEGPDAVVVAAHIVTAIQSLAGRFSDPADPVQLTIGRIEGGSKADVPSDRVTLDGVLRTLSEASRERLPRAIENAAKGIAQSLGGEAVFTVNEEVPAVYNHPELFNLLRPSFDEALGEKRFLEIKPQMMADDFGRYSQRTPSFYFLLGARTPRMGPMAPLHSAYFNPDERTIGIGIKILVHLILNCLDQQVVSEKAPH